ncbi:MULTISPECIES: DUF2933 domain-containing protein [Rhizobium]|uniref:DUF2933 domain-containing protein n=1 Tax=Rhizobium TaxID=379 RepID=UPI001B336A3E|nr:MULTISPECIES: DUF2933 domain-containing protein [Rhizobium]MBX4906810.1 DUF2933 domain-containing protein [Rhizobium bangladeshense]MBX5217296.1 DUF2933 domain-containing protein [Rhizobium sp. NLR9a]MBX5221850.1 DUF2933 domain-containing protein [Rhizobium sp. NLR8a]MBX5227852.1 DUF2933 domain-containing protein [Rhizobium sp. NLR9b]MBX5234280.1 DUF2933 domain-containing protein [Rhizobium sp. NLR4a]
MNDNHPPSAWSSYSRTVFIAFAAIALALIAYEHRVHVLGILPWLLILACPLMHLFMHHGHGGHGGHSGQDHANYRAGMSKQDRKEADDV